MVFNTYGRIQGLILAGALIVACSTKTTSASDGGTTAGDGATQTDGGEPGTDAGGGDATEGDACAAACAAGQSYVCCNADRCDGTATFKSAGGACTVTINLNGDVSGPFPIDCVNHTVAGSDITITATSTTFAGDDGGRPLICDGVTKN